MRIQKNDRRGWTIWNGEFAVVGFRRSDCSMVLNNFSGRYTVQEIGSLGVKRVDDVLDERMLEICSRYLKQEVTDNLVSVLMGEAVDVLLSMKHDGMIIEIEPLFVHDCDDCVFLGRSADQVHDLYFCDQQAGPFPTVIARYGSKKYQNKSGLLGALSGHDVELKEALLFAVNAGMFLGREHVLERMGSREQVDVLFSATG